MAHMKETGKPRPWIVKKDMSERRVDNSKKYTGKAWVKLSQATRQQKPLCEVCDYKGKLTACALVDHVVPVAQGGAFWNAANHMVMCHRCHNSKSGKEAHKDILIPYHVLPSGEKIPANREDIKKLLTKKK